MEFGKYGYDIVRAEMCNLDNEDHGNTNVYNFAASFPIIE